MFPSLIHKHVSLRKKCNAAWFSILEASQNIDFTAKNVSTI